MRYAIQPAATEDDMFRLTGWTRSKTEALASIEADPRQQWSTNCDTTDETGQCQGHQPGAD